MSLQGDKGNVFLTDDVIINEVLRLLKNNLVAAPLVYRDLEKRFGKLGDIISLKLPFRTKSASGRVLVKQPLVDIKQAFKINHQEHFGMDFTVRDRTLTIGKFADQYITSGIAQIANKIDESIILEGRKAFFGSGSPGTSVSTKSFLYAKAYMNKVGVMDDGMRRAIMDPVDCAEISDEIAKKYSKNVDTIIAKGYMGELGGFNTFESNNIFTHTVGDYGGSPQVAGADQTGSSVNTDGWSNNKTVLKVGDVFQMNGVYEINPQSYKTTGRLQNFVVTADVTSDGSGEATIPFSPSINDGSATTLDREGNSVSLSAYQNVTAEPANNATITVMGDANAIYRQNLLFHRDAMALVMIDLELPASATVKARARDADSGLSMSMTQAYDITEHVETTRVDAVWGVDMIYPELAHRLWSASAE